MCLSTQLRSKRSGAIPTRPVRGESGKRPARDSFVSSINSGGQVLIFLSNLRMVPRARLSCWFLRRAFGEELVSKFLDSPDCENIHPYAAPFTRCGQQDCEREFYRGLLGKEVRNDFVRRLSSPKVRSSRFEVRSLL